MAVFKDIGSVYKGKKWRVAEVIKGITPINLFALQICLFLIYSGARAWAARRKRYKY